MNSERIDPMTDQEAARTDVMTPAQRSRCMSRIRGKNTKPELLLRKALWRKGARYRLHYKIPGRPDIVFVGKRIAVFVDGCFWHGCPEHGVSPKTNAAFWRKKIRGNVERDRRITEELRRDGWTVLRFWEHEVRDDLEGVVSKVLLAIETDTKNLAAVHENQGTLQELSSLPDP